MYAAYSRHNSTDRRRPAHRIAGMMTARFLLHVREWQGGAPTDTSDRELNSDISSSIGQFRVADTRETNTIETSVSSGDPVVPNTSNPTQTIGATSTSEADRTWSSRARHNEPSTSTMV